MERAPRAHSCRRTSIQIGGAVFPVDALAPMSMAWPYYELEVVTQVCSLDVHVVAPRQADRALVCRAVQGKHRAARP